MAFMAAIAFIAFMALAIVREFAAPSRKTTFSFSNNGQSHEGNESDGSHEGHACYEEEGSEQDRQGQSCQISCFPWHQGEDNRWYDQIGSDQEQEWQDCEQEAVGKWQEGFRPHQGLDCCCPEGQEGFGRQGLRRSEEGNSSLQEGQGALPVSSTREHTKASAQGVGMSTPLERSCFDWNDVW